MRLEPIIDREEYERLVAEGMRLRITQQDLLERNARLYPEKEALVDAHRRLTFAQLKRGVDALSAGLVRLGVGRGDVVVAQLPNCCEYFFLLYALYRVGAIGLFITADLRGQEVEEILAFTEARGVVVPARLKGYDYPEMIRNLRPRLPRLEQVFVTGPDVPGWAVSLEEQIQGDPAGGTAAELAHRTHAPWEVGNLTTTSGTTGAPKVIPQVQLSIIGNAIAERTALSGDDVVLAMSPLRGGPCNPNRSAAGFVAARSVLQETFNPEESLELIEREGVTVACGVPAQMVRILETPGLARYNHSSLRLFYFAGAAIGREIAEAIRAKLGCQIIAEYGCMDAGVLSSTRWDDPPEVGNTTIGRPMPGVAARLVDPSMLDVPPGEVGELIVSGASVRSGGGYYRNPAAEAGALTPDGWYLTGDLAVLRTDGNLAVVGRRKDLIIRGGQNISPREVEDLIAAHPKVVDVALVGYADRVMGERACAFVIPRQGESLTLSELTEFMRSRNVAMHKLPERLELVQDFPMVADGQKVNKNVLRQQVERRLGLEKDQ